MPDTLKEAMRLLTQVYMLSRSDDDTQDSICELLEEHGFGLDTTQDVDN